MERSFIYYLLRWLATREYCNSEAGTEAEVIATPAQRFFSDRQLMMMPWYSKAGITAPQPFS